ncbi:MAG TPA: hypothetical protein PL066_01020 [bacterium]|nr:hypothetical protein [bacterium]
MDNWTRQFYQNELKEIYKPEEKQEPKKKMLDEIKEEISLKKMKAGLFKTLKKTLIFFVIVGGVALLIFGGAYLLLKFYIS